MTDGNAFNPVSGDLVNGDNGPQVTMAKIVIVPSPQPSFITRFGNAGGVIQSVFVLVIIFFSMIKLHQSMVRPLDILGNFLITIREQVLRFLPQQVRHLYSLTLQGDKN